MSQELYRLMADLPPPTPGGTRRGWQVLRWSAYITVATVISASLIVFLLGGGAPK